jgi:uncharacterized membrane protein YeaQ/YmgE (transglycosylase-associated protein family)
MPPCSSASAMQRRRANTGNRPMFEGSAQGRCQAVHFARGCDHARRGEQHMFNIIGAIISGLIVGVLARFFYPGAVEMGWIATILLGIAGSLLAGLVVSRGSSGFSRAGFLASFLGAIVLIFFGRMLGVGI